MADETDTADELDTSTPDASTQPMAPLLAPGSSEDGTQAGDPGDWKPPQTDEQGFAIDGHGYPINLRLRALRLADAGETEDPAGSVSPEVIQSAADQLADYDDAYPSLDGMTKAALEAEAEDKNVAVPDGATKDEIKAAIEAARPARIG